MKFKFLAVGACVALLSGCAVDQQREVKHYRQVVEQRWPATQAATQSATLTLHEALSAANSLNERLNLSGEQYLQALIERDRAAGNFWPTLSLAPTYNVQENTGGAANGGASAANTRLDVPLSGQVNLFNGFRDIATLRRSRASVTQRQNLLLDAQEQLLLDVASAFYQVLQTEQLVAVLENSLRLQEERVRDIQARQRVGTARPLDVAQTEAQASATRVALIRARSDVRTGRQFLEFLIAVPVGERALLDPLTVRSPRAEVQEVQRVALESRSDLQAAVAGIEAARQDVQAAVGRYYPSIGLNVNYFLKRETVPTDADWNALLAANLPIFSAFQIEAAVRNAWSQFRQAKLSESLLRRQVLEQAAVAHEQLASSRRRLVELDVQVSAAREAFRQADQSYNVGLATNLERLVAQDRLLTAELDLATENYSNKLLYLNLLRAVGRLTVTLQPLVNGRPATMPATTTSPATLPATMPQVK